MKNTPLHRAGYLFNQVSYIVGLYIKESGMAGSELDYVGRLHAALTFRQIVLDSLAFIERLKAFSLNRGVMNKHVLAILAGDKAITFFCVEPLYCTLHYGTSTP